MKKTVITIVYFLLYFSSAVIAQLQVKEGYEKARKWYTDTYYSNIINTVHINDSGNEEPERLQAYEGIAEAIQSHITMYRTTRDKAHLVKAINMGMDLVNKRTYYHTWSDFTEDEVGGYWYDGFAAAALAELAYIMIAEPNYYPDIIYKPIPVQLLTNQVPAGLPPAPTYGAIGSWFRDRVNETMTYYGAVQWADDAGFFIRKKNYYK